MLEVERWLEVLTEVIQGRWWFVREEVRWAATVAINTIRDLKAKIESLEHQLHSLQDVNSKLYRDAARGHAFLLDIHKLLGQYEKASQKPFPVEETVPDSAPEEGTGRRKRTSKLPKKSQ